MVNKGIKNTVKIQKAQTKYIKEKEPHKPPSLSKTIKPGQNSQFLENNIICKRNWKLSTFSFWKYKSNEYFEIIYSVTSD